MALIISNDLIIGNDIQVRGISASKNTPNEKKQKANNSNFPFNLVSGLSAFNDSLTNSNPEIKKIIIKEISKMIKNNPF